MILTCKTCKTNYQVNDWFKNCIKWYSRGKKYGFECDNCFNDLNDIKTSPALIPNEYIKIQLTNNKRNK